MTEKHHPASLLDDVTRAASWLWKFRPGKTLALGALPTDPALSSDYRGALYVDEGSAGVADELVFIRKNAADAYEFATLSTEPDAGGTGTPGGSTTQVQFNDAGNFGGDAGLTYAKATDTLTAGKVIVADDAYAAGWNASLEVPTKNAVYDKIETIVVSGTSPGGSTTQVQFNDASSFGGDAGLTYNKTTDALTIAGNLSVTGIASQPTVINSASVDADTQIKGDTDANLLYVDAGADRVGIGTNAPGTKLHVVGGARVTGLGGGGQLLVQTNTSGTLLASNTATSDVIVPNDAYAGTWDGNFAVPTKNAVYDKIASLPGPIYDVGPLTIASGIITLPAIPSGTAVINVQVETEGSVASDNLDTIETTPPGGSIFTEGTLLVLRPFEALHQVIVTTRDIANTPPTSNVLLNGLQSRPLTWFQSALLLSYYQGTWIEVGYHHPTIGWTIAADSTQFIGNAQGVDVDLRYDGSLNPNLLYLDAGAERVGIGTDTPATTLDVVGDGTFTQGLTAESLTLLGSSTVGTDFPRLTFYDTTGPANGKYWWINHYKDAVEFAALDDSQVAWAVWLHASRSGLTVPQVTVNYTGGDTDFNVKGDTDTNLFYTDASTDRIGIGTATPAEKLDVVGNIAVSGVLQFPGTANPMINLAGTAYGIGIAAAQNQYFVDTTGRHSFRTGGYNGTQIALLGFDGIVLNQSAADLDTRISGDTDVNLFYADASADSIGIGTSTPSSWFDLKAGTTARAPLRFPSGTNLTTPLAGTVEYDGNVFYTSNAASARGLLPSRHHARIDAGRNLVDDTSNQAIFPSANDALTVIAGATYRFRWVCQLTKGTNNVATSILFGGTATFTTIQYVSLGVTATTGSAQTPAMNNGTAATSTNVAIAGTGANVRFLVEGEFEVNGAGTIIPQVTFSGATGSTPTVNIGTFFECWRLGANPVTAIGPWA